MAQQDSVTKATRMNPSKLWMIGSILVIGFTFLLFLGGVISAFRMSMFFAAAGLVMLYIPKMAASDLRLSIEGKIPAALLDYGFTNALYFGTFLLGIRSSAANRPFDEMNLLVSLAGGIFFGGALAATGYFSESNTEAISSDDVFDVSKPVSERPLGTLLYYFLPAVSLAMIFLLDEIQSNFARIAVYALIVVLQTSIRYYPIKKNYNKSAVQKVLHTEIVAGWGFLGLSLLCTLLF